MRPATLSEGKQRKVVYASAGERSDQNSVIMVGRITHPHGRALSSINHPITTRIRIGGGCEVCLDSRRTRPWTGRSSYFQLVDGQRT